MLGDRNRNFHFGCIYAALPKVAAIKRRSEYKFNEMRGRMESLLAWIDRENFWNRTLPFGHGIYYLITGIWPIVSPDSFQAITGPKVDMWVVKTTGALISVIGGVLTWVGLRGSRSPEVPALGIGSAVSLAGSDIIYATSGKIRRIYLLEAMSEAALIVLCVARMARSRH
jgi:hypothetical protein